MANGDFTCTQQGNTLSCKSDPISHPLDDGFDGADGVRLIGAVALVLFFSGIFSILAGLFPDVRTMVFITGGVLLLLILLRRVSLINVLSRFGL